MKSKSPTHEDLVRLFGQIDDHSAAEILALRPSLEDLEEAAAYVAGESDVMGEERHPLASIVASVYEVITRDEAQDEDSSS